MARQIVNIGTDANDGSGDTIRDSFNKVNDNFAEVYANIVALSDGNVTTDIKGNVFGEDSTLLVDAVNGIIPWAVVDSTPTTLVGYGITDAFDGEYSSLTNKPTIPNLAAVNQSIIPDTDVAYDLGSFTNRFRDLHLSGNTIFLGAAPISLNPLNGLISLPIDAATSLGLPPITAGINGFYGLSIDFSEGRAINPATSTAIAPNAELKYFQDLNFGNQVFAYSKIVFATPIPGYGAGIEYEYFNFPEIRDDGKTPPTIVADIDGSGNLLSLEITAIGDATGAGEGLLFHPTGDPGSLNGGQVGLQDADGTPPIVTAPGGKIAGYVSIAELKNIASTSATYAEFQAAIAAL